MSKQQLNQHTIISKTLQELDVLFPVKLVHAFVTSRVDYCNGPLPKKMIRQLQLIQNTAAWTLTRTRTSEHITPVLSPTSVIKHRVNRYFLVLHPKWKTKNTKKINQSKPVKPFLLGMKECGLLVPKQKRQRAKNVHFSIGMSVFKKCS